MLLAHFKAKCDCVKGEETTKSELLLLTGGNEPMKYRGITIKKHTTCNTWYARYRANGKQFYVSAKSQKECYNKLKKELSKINRELKTIQNNKESKVITFINWYKQWFNLYKNNKVKEITINDYNASLNYLQEIFNTPLDEITNLKIIELINKIDYVSRKKKVFELLKTIFDKAILNSIIDKNPLNTIEKPKHKKQSGISLSNNDEELFKKECIKQNNLMFLVCLYQGLRRGEMLALTSDDFDLKEKSLTINKSINELNKLSDTKNEYSSRIMPLFDKTIDLIKDKLTTGNKRIFNYTISQCSDSFQKIKKQCFPNKKYTIHSLRHTFITKCQEANIPLHIIQKWVGHVIGSNVTNSVYTHIREKAELVNIEIINKYST